jgi:hypothetical protein
MGSRSHGDTRSACTGAWARRCAPRSPPCGLRRVVETPCLRERCRTGPRCTQCLRRSRPSGLSCSKSAASRRIDAMPIMFAHDRSDGLLCDRRSGSAARSFVVRPPRLVASRQLGRAVVIRFGRFIFAPGLAARWCPGLSPLLRGSTWRAGVLGSGQSASRARQVSEGHADRGVPLAANPPDRATRAHPAEYDTWCADEGAADDLSQHECCPG